MMINEAKIKEEILNCLNESSSEENAVAKKYEGNRHVGTTRRLNESMKTKPVAGGKHVLYWRDSDDNSGTHGGTIKFSTLNELEKILKNEWKTYFMIYFEDNWEEELGAFAKKLFARKGKYSMRVPSDDDDAGRYLGQLITSKEQLDNLREKFGGEFDDMEWDEDSEESGEWGDAYAPVDVIVDPPKNFREF